MGQLQRLMKLRDLVAIESSLPVKQVRAGFSDHLYVPELAPRTSPVPPEQKQRHSERVWP